MSSLIDRMENQAGLERDDLEITQKGKSTLIRQAAERPNILDCIWEYIQNSYDALRNPDNGKTPEVIIEYIRDAQNNIQHLRISDNGHGMYLNTEDPKGDEKLNILRIIKKIGESSKKGEPLKKGENGTGSLVHLNMTQKGTGRNAGKWVVVSKNNGHPTCQLEIVNNETIDAYRGQASTERTKEGTDVLFANLSSRTVTELKNKERLMKYIGFEFADWIEDESAMIIVKDGSLEELVEPHKPSGKLIVSEKFKMPAKKAGQKELDVTVELYLHPKQKEKSIAIRTFAKAPVKDISKLERFDAAPWNTGYISGSIKCPSLPEDKMRRGLDLNDERVEDFFSEIERRYKAKLEETVNEYKKHSSKDQRAGMYSQAAIHLQDLFKEKYNELIGGPTDVEYIEDPDGKEMNGGRKRKQRGPPTGDETKRPEKRRGPNKKPSRFKVDPSKEGLIKAIAEVKERAIIIQEVPSENKDEISFYDGHGKVYINNANPIFIEYQQMDKVVLNKYIAEAVISAVLQHLHTREKPEIVFREFYPLKKKLYERLNLSN